MKNDELDDLALNLYRKYPAVFDLVSTRAIPEDGIDEALREIYLSVLNEFKQEGQISDCEPEGSTNDFLFFTTSKMDEYLENRSHSISWEGPDATYKYWIYSYPGTLKKPSVVFEVNEAGRSPQILDRIQTLRDFCWEERKPIKSGKNVAARGLFKLCEFDDVGIDESKTLRIAEIDEEEIAEKIRNAIDRMLKFESSMFEHLEGEKALSERDVSKLEAEDRQ